MTIAEAIKAHNGETKNSKVHTKFKVQMGKEKCQEITTCKELMDHLNNLDEGSVLWDLRNIVSHQGPLNKNHPSHVGSPHNAKVEWENQ